MRILFVGGTRFAGRRAVAMLVAAGHAVVVLSRRRGDVVGARCVIGERSDRATLDRAFSAGRFDAVVDNIAFRPAQVMQILERLRGARTRYLFTSSHLVYGRRATALRELTRETDADLEHVDGNAYANGKRRCERVLMACAGVAWTILRPCNIDGPDDPSDRRGFWIDRVDDGEGVLIPNEWDHPHPATCAEDVATALVLATTTRRRKNAIYNVASRTITIGEHLEAVARAARRPKPFLARLPTRQIHRRLGRVYIAPLQPRCVLDTSALCDDLGFVPSSPGRWLPETIAWWRATGQRSIAWGEQRGAEIALLRELRAEKSQ